MALTFDGPNKEIHLGPGDTSLSVRDLWSRYIDWYLTDDNSKYGIWMFTVGGDDIDTAEGTKIPVYCFLEEAQMVHPDEANHTLKVSDGILLVQGGGDPFMPVPGYTVKILYQQPVQAISFVAGESTGLTPDTIADAVRLEMDTESRKLKAILNNMQ